MAKKKAEWDFDATTTVESNRRMPSEEVIVERWDWYSVRWYWPTRYNGGRRHLYRRVAGSNDPWRSICGLIAPQLNKYRDCYGHLPLCKACERIAGFRVHRYVRRRVRRNRGPR